MTQAFLHTEPLACITDNEAANEILGRVGHVSKQILREVKAAICDVAKGFLLCLPTKRGVAGQQHICQHTQAPDVCGKGDGLVLQNLWSDVIRSADDLADLGALADDSGDAEVAEQDVSLRER